MALVLVISICLLVLMAAALSDKYSKMGFSSSKEPSQEKGLPPIFVSAVEVAKWSDGTAARMHQE